ncbi:TMV resistance protein N-like [Dorcoceras hygrometricum]|uniref:TMV resistance protein N-like n=1 Tax=Dorcoceras hygrometricum TaxID=472368 RepID=A0A2Z7BVQ7_9LAMI|nr:TMV resistance protein N-like [Dorcoceras hygrometricum]
MLCNACLVVNKIGYQNQRSKETITNNIEVATSREFGSYPDSLNGKTEVATSSRVRSYPDSLHGKMEVATSSRVQELPEQSPPFVITTASRIRELQRPSQCAPREYAIQNTTPRAYKTDLRITIAKESTLNI